MAKITLTADEEIMYLEKLDLIQEMMPELEIEVITKPVLPRVNNNLGDDFKQFLTSNTTIISAPVYRRVVR